MSDIQSELPTTDAPKATNSRLYLPGETLYGAIAERALQFGWTIIPQERGERRISSRIDGRALKWGEYIERQPTAEEVRHWSNQAPGANGAILLGRPSGLVYCYDIDVLDAELSTQIQVLAEDKLGFTRFARQGQAPKMALFYRVAREEDLPANKAHRFAGEGDHLLEVQAKGKLVTAFGYHHKTDRYFEWEGPQPGSHSVELVPLVTPEQHEAFIEAVQQLRSFARPPNAGAGDGMVFEGDGSLEVSREGWTIPRVYCDEAKIVDGRVVDGRKQWLSAMVFALVRYNPERAAASTAALIDVAMGIAAERVDNSQKPIDMRSIVVSKANRDADNLRAGNIKSLPKVEEKDGKRKAKARGVLPTTSDPALWHLPTADKRKALDIASRSAPDAGKAAERAIVLDRTPIAAAVGAGIVAALDEFFEGVYDGDRESLQPVHVLDAPTGSGKTTKTAAYIIEDPRTKSFDDAIARGEDAPGPIVFSLPTYANIDEVRARAEQLQLDPNLSDDELAAQARAMDIMTEAEAQEEIERFKVIAAAKSVRIMGYEGKRRHCKFPDRMDALQDAGIPTGGMCKGKVKKAGEFVDEFCPFYSSCEAILQKQRIRESHVVFLPHAFFSLSIPEDLSNARCVIADERLFTMAVHTTQLNISTLSDVKRAPPPLGKKEKELITKGIVDDKKKKARIDAVALDYVQDRDLAAEIAVAAYSGQTTAELVGRWPDAADLISVLVGDGGKATVLAAQTAADKKSNRRITGKELVHSAMRVTGAGSSRNVAVHPGMDDEAFADLVARPTGVQIGEEYRYWQIIEERINALEGKTAKQSREQRLQHRSETIPVTGEHVTVETVRLSWRSELNWSAAPMLLLDASADERIIGKVFTGRPVMMHRVAASMNLKAVVIADSSRSTSSLTPAADILSPDSLNQARNVHRVRAVENFLASVHANGRFLTGTAKKVRSLLRDEYLPLPNIDDLHYGAERGLNFAESHVAGLAIGRSEPPTWVLDGIAAALGYDDEEELLLLDPRGDGMHENGDPIKPLYFEQHLQMRDGSDVYLQVPMAPEGTWQRLVQIQLRDESIRQFIGRLRPVYRCDTPIVYIMSQCIPSGIIVDDIITTSDLIPAYAPLLDASRSLGGILDPQRLHRERPDLGTLEQFKGWFEALPAQLKACFHAVRVSKKSIGVPAHYEDALATAAAVYPDCGEPEMIRAATKERVAPAGVRPADKIEEALGSRDERAAAEVEARARAIEWLDERHRDGAAQTPYLPSAGRYVVGVDKDGRPVQLGLTSIAMLTRPKPKDEDETATVEQQQRPTSIYMDEHDWEIAI